MGPSDQPGGLQEEEGAGPEPGLWERVFVWNTIVQLTGVKRVVVIILTFGPSLVRLAIEDYSLLHGTLGNTQTHNNKHGKNPNSSRRHTASFLSQSSVTFPRGKPC